jgi:tetratricopeptide (TPR) repeat protein
MTAHTESNSYERGISLAEAGKHAEALNCVREHLRTAPNHVEALNDAGTILHCLGRQAEAISYLSKARSLRPDSTEIVWNLVEAYLAAGLPSEVASLFDAMEQMGILNVDVLNRTATQLLDQGRKGETIDTLMRSYHRWPEQDVLKSIVDVIRVKRPKVMRLRTGAGREDTLSDAWDFVQERFQTECLDASCSEETLRQMPASSILWLDGGGSRAAAICRERLPGKIVVGLRRSDVYGDWVRQVRWENVDIVVQVGSSAVEEALAEYVPDIRNRTRLVVVPYAVNLDRYPLRQRPSGKNVACLGRLSVEANLGFLIQCMQKLSYMDSGYHLFLAGEFETPLLDQYVHYMVRTLGLSNAVSFEPYPDDVNAWLSDKQYVVSSGIGEGQVETVLAAMAAGLKPIVHNFPAAGRLLPSECLFNISEEFCRRALAADYESGRYRRFVEERYPVQAQLKQINGILTQLETEIDLAAPESHDEQSPVSMPSIPVRSRVDVAHP